MTPEEELAKIREEHQPCTAPGTAHCRCQCPDSPIAGAVSPCETARVLTLAAQLARDHARSGCGGGCGDIIARKIEGAK